MMPMKMIVATGREHLHRGRMSTYHGVACNCVKIQLEHLGLDTEFAQCEIQVDEKDWEGVRRKYWHGRNTYYLPIVTWKKQKKNEEEKGGLER